jgi:3-hydroxyisobutyrate dehydrogenase-like beta-hydroxyacid dehydrogenase
MDIGFIGLGAMGKAMAGNLLKAGHHLRVWNRSKEPVQELASQGAEPAQSPREAFRGDAVVSMLADDAALRHVLLESQLLVSAPKSVIHVNMATISVAFAKELARAHSEHGLSYVAAPVFGRPDVAAAAKLNIVAAGDPSAIGRVQPLFDAMGQKTWPVGDEPYRANVVKLAGNFMLGCAIEAMAEACAVAKVNGVAPADVLEMLTNSLFAAPVYKGYGALIAEERYEPAMFKLALAFKDVRLALAAGEEAHVPMPFASVLRDNLIEAVAQGDGNKDFAALARVTARRAGLSGG